MEFWRNFRCVYSAAMDAHDDLGFTKKAGKHSCRSFRSTTGSSSGDGGVESSFATSESETDVPNFFPVPFQELATVEYNSIEERLRNAPDANTTANPDSESPVP